MRTRSYAALLALLVAGGASAEGPAPIFNKVGVTERLGEPIPTALQFTDSTGKQVMLSDAFKDGKPVLLNLVYYRCPMLCELVLSGIVRGLRDSGMHLGEDYRVVTVSIDPTEDAALAAEKKRGYLQSLGVSTTDPNWMFLVGSEQNVKALANAVGFRYAYDAQLKQYAHSAVSFILSPEGKISRYLYGVEYASRDLRLSMVEAAGGKVGTTIDRVLLTCYKFDPATRKYGFFVKGFLRIGGLTVFAALSCMLALLWRRELKRGTVS